MLTDGQQLLDLLVQFILFYFNDKFCKCIVFIKLHLFAGLNNISAYLRVMTWIPL